MSHSQFHSIKCLYLDMHGLIFADYPLPFNKGSTIS